MMMIYILVGIVGFLTGLIGGWYLFIRQKPENYATAPTIERISRESERDIRKGISSLRL